MIGSRRPRGASGVSAGLAAPDVPDGLAASSEWPPSRRDQPARQPRVVVVTRRPQPSGPARKIVSQVRGQALGFRRFDLTLIGSGLALSLLGSLLVWSATRGKLVASGDDPKLFLTKHLLNLLIGVVLAWGITRLDYRTMRAYTPVIYAAVIFSLLLVLTPVGTSINGAHAWLNLPAGFTLQPGEFAKIAVILMMAVVLSERGLGTQRPANRDVKRALLCAAGPVALIMLQPDLGTVLVIGSVVIGLVAASGARLIWVLGLAGSAVVGAGTAIALGLLDRYQLDRLLTFTDPGRDPLGIGYNTMQARIAIGSGGLFGSGLFHGHQTQGAFVPYQQTDFVFSVAGEELGFIGAALIIGLLGVIVWRGCVIARRARDPYGRIVATGVVLWFAFQAFENIGMNLGIMPVTGVPLPFVSYGGTSMFAAWAGIGLLQSVSLRSRT